MAPFHRRAEDHRLDRRHLVAVPASIMRPLDGDTGADVCIIGANFVGLRTAYDLLRNGKSVVVIDAGPSLPVHDERDEEVHRARLNDLLTGAGTEEQPEFDDAWPATTADLAREVLRLGGRIHLHTLALDITAEHNMQVVTTYVGAIVARVVVVANDEDLPGAGQRRADPAHPTNLARYRVLATPATPAAPGALPAQPRAA